MFLKLLKYEFRSAGKWYFGLYGLILGLSLMTGGWLKQISGGADSIDARETMTGIIFLILGILVVSMFVSTLLLIIRRFYKNVYGREGYLLFTLPVSTHSIILSKLLAAFIWQLLSALVVFTGFVLLLIPSMPWRELLIALPTIFDEIPISVSSYLLTLFISSFSGILMIYLAISIGQLFENRRGQMGFVAYVCIYILQTIITSFLPTSSLFLVTDSGDIDFTSFSDYMLQASLISLVSALIFYFATHYIMKNRLNIQ